MAPRDERMQLVIEIKTGKKSQPMRYKQTILGKEDIGQMISDTLGQIDTTMINADMVQVVAFIVKSGGRPSCHQEYPCRTDKIQSLTPMLTRGLKAALTEPDKEDLGVQVSRGINNITTIGKEGIVGVMRLKSSIQALTASGLVPGQPMNPVAAMGAMRDLASTFAGDTSGGGDDGAPDILGSIMGMIANPNGADVGQMLNGILGGLAKDPETAQLATMLGGLVSGLKPS